MSMADDKQEVPEHKRNVTLADALQALLNASNLPAESVERDQVETFIDNQRQHVVGPASGDKQPDGGEDGKQPDGGEDSKQTSKSKGASR
jgi:dsDNA-binding SOS-regulon protein